MSILPMAETSPRYADPNIFLFMGGFMIAMAMQKWQLHKRLALHVIAAVGGGPSRLLAGFMIATAFLSMWISNTACTMMMVPIALAVLAKFDDFPNQAAAKKFTVGLLLGLAWGASIGGMATLVGTPPNMAFTRIFEVQFPDAPPISFAQWFIFALPLSIILFAFTWVFLQKFYMPKKSELTIDSSITTREAVCEAGADAFIDKAANSNQLILTILQLKQ